MTLEQFSSSLYQYPDDQECLHLFVRVCRTAGDPRDFPTPIDLRELLALPQVRAATRLWRASDGVLAAYALVDPYHNLVFDIDPHIESSALEDEIATWGVQHQHAATSGSGSAPTLDSSCRADDRRRIAMLQRHGFTRQEVESIHLERNLSLPIPSHPLPAGFVIRPSTGELEVADWVALHRAAFDSDLMTAAMRRAMLDEPLYQSQTWTWCASRLAGGWRATVVAASPMTILTRANLAMVILTRWRCTRISKDKGFLKPRWRAGWTCCAREAFQSWKWAPAVIIQSCWLPPRHLVLSSPRPASGFQKPSHLTLEHKMHPDLQFIYQRRSIRKFTTDPIPTHLLDELLRAVMAAPSASNSQPWEFIIVTAKETIKRLRRTLPFAQYEATAAIAVLGSPLKARNAAGVLYWVQDCSAAVENILLAASALGLGAVWIGCHPVKPEVWGVRRVLGIPRTSIPMAVIMLGFPAEEKPARTRYDPKKVHWEAYRRNQVQDPAGQTS